MLITTNPCETEWCKEAGTLGAAHNEAGGPSCRPCCLSRSQPVAIAPRSRRPRLYRWHCRRPSERTPPQNHCSAPATAHSEAAGPSRPRPEIAHLELQLPNTIEQGAPAQADLLDVTEGSPKISPVAGRSLIIYNTPRISIYFIS